MATRLAALTGATGFLGGHVARAMAGQGWRLRLLVRGEPADLPLPGPGAELVRGDLADTEALRRLCDGAEAIVHVAGVVKVRHAELFREVNAVGAGRVAEAAYEIAPEAGFVLVSSLAARAPQLSAYAASKRDGEAAVRAALGGAPWIVRPPAIYGPGDRATLGLFQAAAASPLLPVLRPGPRLPLIHVRDAASAIAAAASWRAPGRTVALCDGRNDGYSLDEIMSQAAAAVGRRARRVGVPAALVRAAGLAGEVARVCGASPMVTSGKIRELLDGDWRITPDELAANLPAASFDLQQGFRHTVAGYRAAGWLSAPSC